MPDKKLIFIPTYNEAENVKLIYQQIKALNLSTDLLFLDDNSPDGTGQIIDSIVTDDPKIHVIHRLNKDGIGSAHLDGIRWAYHNGFTHLITMDCDFSHSPTYLSTFLEYGRDFDIVVASRHMANDSLQGWSWFRKILTYLGHWLTKTILKLPYDATGAYRLYRLDNIPQGAFELITAKGYSFFFESLLILHLNQYSIKEFPVQLSARTYGHSKMKIKDMFESLSRLNTSYWKVVRKSDKYIYHSEQNISDQEFHPESKPYIDGGELSSSIVQDDWDQYWNKKKTSENMLYDAIARFYRRFIIKPYLNYFIKKHFPQHSEVLHAGCGSGQVDMNISHWLNITAMDISANALDLYKKYNSKNAKTLHGDIFNIPDSDNSYDGIYNLGVMEHFTEDEIQKILLEFRKKIKKGGKIVLFWPPEFGLTVNVLKFAHFILNDVLKKNVKLHPDEISRIRSKEHAVKIIEKSGFHFVEYYFGPKDLFTQVVVVAEKM